MSAREPLDSSSEGALQITRPQRRRQRRNGRLVPVKHRPYARPAVRFISHGGSRALLREALDRRTSAGKAYAVRLNALAAHLGGHAALSVPQQALIDQAARLHLLGLFAWAELTRAGLFAKGLPRPAFDVYRRAAADEREVLRLLGLERRVAEKTLAEYLDAQDG